MGFGPRFLHSTGQLHKGDRGNGLFIQLVSLNGQDIAIPLEAGSPDSEISYGILKQAQALGDGQALRDAGRRVLSFHMEGDAVSELESFAKEIR